MQVDYPHISRHESNPPPDYEFEALLGQGSFGCVYKAFDFRRRMPVAVKRSSKVGSMVSREFKVLCETSDCAHCVRLLDIFYTLTAEGGYI